MKKLFALFSLMVIFSSCKTYTEEEKEGFDKAIRKYIRQNDLSLQKSSSGLYKKLISRGNGQNIHYTDSVSITYEGKLLNGKLFDNQKSPQTLAIRDLITGWKEVLVGARKGDEWMMILPPQLGYGQNKLDVIPVNSILVFKMKIKDVK